MKAVLVITLLSVVNQFVNVCGLDPHSVLLFQLNQCVSEGERERERLMHDCCSQLFRFIVPLPLLLFFSIASSFVLDLKSDISA